MFTKKMFLITLLSLVFASSSFATYLPTPTNVLSLGGNETSSNLTMPESNPQGYFTIYASIDTPTAIDRVFPFHKNGVAYQVSGGVKFKATKICIWGRAAGLTKAQLMSDTAPFAANATVGSLTAPVWMTGMSANYPLINANAAGVQVCYSTTYEFSASTYPGFQTDSNADFVGMYITGKEAP